MGREVTSRLRSYVYRGFTKLPEGRRPGARALQRLGNTGPVRVDGGLGKGLVFSPQAVPLDHVQAHGVVRGTLEVSMQEAFRRTVAPGMVVFDVGANVGFFSLIAAQLGGTVHAFEPVPDNVAGIRANAALNGLDVTVHEVAVSDYTGRSTVSLPAEGSWAHLTDLGDHPLAERTLEVDVITLHGLDAPAPDVIKIDVEGYEVEVLKGAAGILRERKPALIVELHGVRNDVVVDLLTEHGYALSHLDGPGPIATAGPTHILAT